MPPVAPVIRTPRGSRMVRLSQMSFQPAPASIFGDGAVFLAFEAGF
jgi:hypothetical protein